MWPVIPATPGAEVKRSQGLSQPGESMNLDRFDQKCFERLGPELSVEEKVLSSIPSTAGTRKKTVASNSFFFHILSAILDIS